MNIHYRSIRDQRMSSLAKPRKGAWVDIVSSSPAEVKKMASQLSLDEGLLLDAIDLYESPRIERADGAIYIYIRYCDPTGKITSTEPMLIVSGPEYLVTVARQPVQELTDLRQDEHTITTQKVKLILQILTRVNHGYRSYINGVTKQIFATRARLQKKVISNDDVLGFIDIEEDLNEFLAALQPYGNLLEALTSGRYFRLHDEDKELIEDLELSTKELIDLSKSRLKTMQNIREAYTTIATNNLNRIFKRLTSITIFLMIPTIVSGLYGMNVPLPFDRSPHTATAIVVLCVLAIGGAIGFFKQRRWL